MGDDAYEQRDPQAISPPYGSLNRTLEVRSMAHLRAIPTSPTKEVRRHGKGRPSVPVHRRAWDTGQRLAAARLDRAEPVWAVSYGLGSRRFYAIAAWPVSVSLILEARSIDELRELMREAERVHRLGEQEHVRRAVHGDGFVVDGFVSGGAQ
jgi:hypothetical protein